MDNNLNTTPTSERLQIGIFGKVNAGKSSVFNILTGQDAAVVSDQPGTTTDPVRKAMEILPLGPVMIYDTPGLSDDTSLGRMREEKTARTLHRTDAAIIVIDAAEPGENRGYEAIQQLIAEFRQRKIPFFIVLNKSDAIDQDAIRQAVMETAAKLSVSEDVILTFSCKDADDGQNITVGQVSSVEQGAKLLRSRVAALPIASHGQKPRLVADLLKPNDMVILVIPIDESAPKGRIILPQQQVIRDVLDAGCSVAATRPQELEKTLDALRQAPRMVITDSQVFDQVNSIIPRVIPLTSFSILMSRYKGDLEGQMRGARAISSLNDGARILISEGCTHHRQCGDIGTVKLPAWIRENTERDFDYHFTSGGEFPEDVSEYELIIHCGGCTLPPQEMSWRLERARECKVPMTNYGIMIAYLHGILDRATELFPINV